MHLLLSGEHITAEQALSMGLVQEVLDDTQADERAYAYAKKLAGHSPIATQAVKAAVRAALEMPFSAGIRYENELHVVCMQANDRLEGIAAFQQGRSAQFKGQ